MCCFVSMKFCNQLLFTGEDGTVLITEFVLLAAFWLSFFSFFYVLCDQFERGTCGFAEARGLSGLSMETTRRRGEAGTETPAKSAMDAHQFAL